MAAITRLLRGAGTLALVAVGATLAVPTTMGEAASAPASAPATGAAPITIMVVGMMHFDNPGLDYRNAVVDDVLAPARQREIEAVVNALAAFRPTLIGTEWRADAVAREYPRFRAGTLPPSRDETVQIAFRLAKQAGTDRVLGMDAPASLPFEAVFAYARDHGQQPVIDHIGEVSDANVAEQEQLLKQAGIAGTLLWLNDPAKARRDHGLYNETLRVGGGSQQPGLEAVAVWYRRNLAICANMLQSAKPGDRLAVFFGAGHLHLLRQCAAETPGVTLVDARDYLARAADPKAAR